MSRSSGGLFLIRVLTAVAILAMSIMSYIAVKMHNPPEWLFKWGTLEIPPKSETGYKIELVALILLALFSLLAFMGQAAAGQFMAFVLGVTLMAIVTGNILERNAPHQFVTYFMTQDNLFITTWICLGLALLCAMSSVWSRTSGRQLAGLVVLGVGITGGTVAIIASVAPSYGLLG